MTNLRSSETNILYGVSSVGLGHVRRSIAIANAIRNLRKDVKIDWVCSEPALSFLRNTGENVLEISNKLESLSSAFEEQSSNGRIQNFSAAARSTVSISKRNYFLIRPHVGNYDLLIQDEFWETFLASRFERKSPLPENRVIVTDFVRLETVYRNPFSRVVLWYANRILRRVFLEQKLRIFADDEAALPASNKLRSWAKQNFQIVGPVVEEILSGSKEELRKELFGESAQFEKFVVFTLGGTSVGKPLVDFAVRNAKWLSERLGMHVVLLVGPRIDISSIQNTSDGGLNLVPFTTESMKYFKASECVVTQAGASTLNEVASLAVPCVSIPIENHWEQQHNARRFAEKFGFGILSYKNLGKEKMLEAINLAISTRHYSWNSSGSAIKAAELICKERF